MSVFQNRSVLHSLPQDWKYVSLDLIVEFFKGKGLPKSKIEMNGKTKCIHYGELFTSYGEIINRVKNKTNLKSGFYSEINDVLMPTSDVTPSGLATASCLKEKGVILGGDILVMRPKNKKIEGAFLAYYIRYNKNQILRLATGSTVYHIYSSALSNLKIPLPPLPEQKKIADILSTVDEKIAVIDHQITATEELKKGLMQSLLTKGIGHTEFKDSPLGKIPKSWSYLKISNVGVLSGGYAFKSKEFNDEGKGYQVIRMSNVQPKGLFKEKNPVFIENLNQKEKHFVLKAGDVLITLTGTIGKKDYGNVAFIKESNIMVLNQRVGRFNYNDKISGLYLFYLFNSENFRKQFFERGKGGTGNQANVGKESFESIRIILPNLKSEQKEIAEILSKVDAKLQTQKDKKQAYLQLKKGLMQQLLTGKIRVNNLIEA